MGRPSKPTEQKRIEGNRGKRGLGRNEPDPDYLDDMTPPAWLPDAAKAVWAEYAPKMRKAKVLTVIDVEPFARWCALVVKFKKVHADLERQGVMIERPAKEGEDAKAAKAAPSHVVNQLVFVESMLQKQLLAVEREFGMTPAARTRVHVDPQLTLFGDDGKHQHQQQPGAAKKGEGYFTGGSTAH
jgi:P27 family predicted phage terminase small subunit